MDVPDFVRDEETPPEEFGKRVARCGELWQQRLLRGHRSEHHLDRDVVLGPVDHRYWIARAYQARRDHPEIGSRGTALGEALDPELVLEPSGERAARDPRRCDLEHARVADLPALADERAIDVEAEGGQVLAEDAVGERAPELCLPLVEVFTGKRVDGLIGPAMGLGVADCITGGAAPPAGASRIAKLTGAVRRPLVDTGHAGIGVARLPSAGRCSRKEALPSRRKGYPALSEPPVDAQAARADDML